MDDNAHDVLSPPPAGLTPEAVALLVESHRRFLGFVERRVGDRHQAEEILQQAFVKALERGHGLRDGESAVAWFYRLLRNALIDHYRRRASEHRALEAVAREPTERADDELMQTVCQCMHALLGTLRPLQAEILRRVDLEQTAVVDFARENGISANNAGVRLHRARKALFDRLLTSCGTCASHGCLDCHCEAAPASRG